MVLSAKLKLPLALNTAKEISLLSQSSVIKKATETPQYDRHVCFEEQCKIIIVKYFP